MSIILPVVIFLEVLLTLFIAWGLMHEDRLIAFENALCRKIKKKINRFKRNVCAKWLAEQGIIIPKQ